MNTLRLADEVNALRSRVKELETEQKETDKWVSKLIDQNVEDARNIAQISKQYNAHLDQGR